MHMIVLVENVMGFTKKILKQVTFKDTESIF